MMIVPWGYQAIARWQICNEESCSLPETQAQGSQKTKEAADDPTGLGTLVKKWCRH